MCWSTKVSLLFVAVDFGFIFCLRSRNAGKDRVYAWFMVPIACQELCQLILWALGAPMEQYCTITNAVFSVLAILSAQMVPVVPLAVAQYESPMDIRKQRYLTLGWIIFFVQALMVSYSLGFAQEWCVRLGPNHHQVWISDQSLFQAGGAALYHLTCTLYALSAVSGALAMNIPYEESVSMIVVGVGITAISFLQYPTTLEACSIWCWTGFTFGLIFWYRPHLIIKAATTASYSKMKHLFHAKS